MIFTSSRENGYFNAYSYHSGVMNGHLMGWEGNSTLDFETFIESTVTMNRNTSTPKVAMRLRKTQKKFEYIDTEEVKMEVLKAIYPVGQCFKVVYPKMTEYSSISGISISSTEPYEIDGKDLMVHLRDKNSGSKKFPIQSHSN